MTIQIQQQLVIGNEYTLGLRNSEVKCKYWGLEDERHIFVRRHPLANNNNKGIQVFFIPSGNLSLEGEIVSDISQDPIRRYAHEGFSSDENDPLRIRHSHFFEIVEDQFK